MSHLKFIFVVLLLQLSWISAEEAKKTVCLNMIVKNETKVIKRSLGSTKPFIDYWVIVDTGSTDGTQEMIKEFMKDIPGELHERSWVNFGYNRTEALNLAKGKADYVMFIDADEEFSYAPGFKLPPLEKDFYYFITEHAGSTYCRTQLIKNALNWHWVGVLHEVVVADNAHTSDTIPGIVNIYRSEGARSSDPDKYKKDAKILADDLKRDPNNSRTVFYLAQSYQDAGEPALALEYYQKRITMKGWDQEVYWSMLRVAALQAVLNYPEEQVIESYMKAFYYRPIRAEALYHAASIARKQGDFWRGYYLSKLALQISEPDDILFLEHWIYDYGLLLENSICSYYVGKYSESQKACLTMLNKPKLPQDVRECVERNINFANAKLGMTNILSAPTTTTATATN